MDNEGTRAESRVAASQEQDSLPGRVAGAQARRDRARLAQAQDDILRLRREVARLEGSAVQRALVPLRHAVESLPGALRAAVPQGLRSRLSPARNTLQRAATWARAALGGGGGGRGTALVIDDHFPQPDRDSGSVDICNMTDALLALGFRVIFAAAKELGVQSAARARLQHAGVTCLDTRDAGSVEAFLAAHGAEIDLCVLCRVYCGGNFLEQVQRDCRKARIVFNSIDLNFLREERKARLLGDPALLAIAETVRLREEHVIASCDLTLVVSSAELDLLAQTMPDVHAVQLPLARPIRPPVAAFAGRRGIGFVGGFAHAPNVDAVRYFLQDIWPLVLRALPDCTLDVVGSDFPAELLHGCPGSVRALGHVPDLGPWFETLRITIAPLRFGAGAKGKVASSLAAGVPCVATSVAAEGMALGAAGGVLVAESPETFAACVRDAMTDAALWQGLSEGALAYARATLSVERWRGRLDVSLRRIGL